MLSSSLCVCGCMSVEIRLAGCGGLQAPSEVRLGWATLEPHVRRILSVTCPNTTALSSGKADAWQWCTQARLEQTGCFKSADRRATLQGSQEVTSDWKNSRAKAHVRLTKVNTECRRAEMYNLVFVINKKIQFQAVFWESNDRWQDNEVVWLSCVRL